MMKKYLVFMILALGYTLAVCAQNIRLFPNYDQLPGPVVRHILQDKEGYMWYSTTDCGLCRDNGYQTEIFNGLPEQGYTRGDRFVYCMCLAPDGNILYGTLNGAWLLDKRTYKVFPFAREIVKGTPVKSIVAAHDSTYWVTSGSVVYHLDKKQQLIRMHIMSYKGQTLDNIILKQDSQHRIWALQNEGGLQCYSPCKGQFEECQWDYPWNPLIMIEDSLRNCFWLSTNGGGVVKYIPSSQNHTQGTIISYETTRPIDTDNTPHRGYIYGLAFTEDDLWTVTSENLYRYRITSSGLQPIDISPLVSSSKKAIESLYSDNAGNLWVASYTPKPFIIINEKENLFKLSIPQIEEKIGYPLIADYLESEADGLWFLQSRMGLLHYDIPTGNLTINNTYLQGNPFPAHDILIKRKKEMGVWTIIGKSIYAVWMENGIIHTQHMVGLPEKATCIYETFDGNLLAGTAGNIFCINVQSGTFTILASSIGYVSDLRQAPDGSIYFMSETLGLGHITPDGKVQSLFSEQIFDNVALDTIGTLYVASADGSVAQYDIQRDKLTPLPAASDTRGCVIKKMEVDRNGHIWILTSLYVKDYNPRTESFRIFNSTDARFNIDYFQDICLTDDKAWLSGAGHIYSVPLIETFSQTSGYFQPTVTAWQIGNRRTLLPYGTKTIELPSDTKQVTFYLSTFNHLNAEKVTFAYRLQENQAWENLPTGMNTLYLQGLQKGKYTLQVKATDEYGTWTAPTDVITINRLPAWWETWWAYTLYAVGTVLVITVIIILMDKQAKEKHRRLMEYQLTEMKFRFFTTISHELRTPLTLIITPLTGIIREISENNSLKSKLRYILTAAEEMLQLVNNLLAFRKLEMKQTSLQLRYGDLIEYTRQACMAFMSLCEKKGLELKFESSVEILNCQFDKYLIHHILFNLLSNAQKFTPAGGRIVVSVTRLDSTRCLIKVADTGIGIPEEHQKHIFERFYQGMDNQENTSEGSGIGLNIVREFAILHQGEISVQSQPGKGSVFSLILPLDLKKQTRGIHSIHDEDVGKADTSINTISSSGGELTVLLIEDNTSLLAFIAESLSTASYRVIKATNANGVDDTLLHHQIDVIVSDIMMPGVSGLELCSKLKNDQRTSHIPIILLTAMAGQEHELTGYQHGADYYITKPFDMDILLGHLDRIQKRMTERRQVLLQAENPDIATLYTSQLDRQFMERVINLIEKKLANPDYDIEQMSSDLCMSRVTMYRKIKTLTGQSPLEFIRLFRIKRAQQLLRSTDLSVTEISEQVGFSSQSYFSRIFNKYIGKQPSEYRKDRTDDSVKP